MRTLKRAFTLIELLIVLVIIGVIYSLAAGLMKAPSKGAEGVEWSLEHLDASLRNAGEGYLKLRCTGDHCETCQLFDARGEIVAEGIDLFVVMPVVHFFDASGYLDSRRYAPGVCFEMERFENGAVSELLLEHNKRFYRYYPLLKPAETYTDFEEAKKSADALTWVPTDQGRYFHERD